MSVEQLEQSVLQLSPEERRQFFTWIYEHEVELVGADSLRDQQRHPLDVTPELEAWLLEAADQPTTPMTNGDFQAVREPVRGR